MALYVKRNDTSEIVRVKKYIINESGEETIWTNEYGKHVIGIHCEWATQQKKSTYIDKKRKPSIGEIIESYKQSPIEFKLIHKTVCDYFEKDEVGTLFPSQRREIVMVRQLSHKISRELLKKPLHEISNSLGCKDHSTVLHSIKVINNLIDTDKAYKEDYEQVLKLCKQKINNLNKRKRFSILYFIKNLLINTDNMLITMIKK